MADTPKRGRPRVDVPLTSLSIRVPAPVHDRLIRIANRAEKSLSELVRDVLILRLR